MTTFTTEEYHLAFAQSPMIGPVRFQALVKKFGDVGAAYYAKESDISDTLGEATARAFVEHRNEYDPRSALHRYATMSIHVVPLCSSLYPVHLLHISDPPIVLYVLCSGELEQMFHDKVCLAVIGSRQNTEYGKHATQHIVRDLVEAGIVIVSGLALGIDAIAHQTAVACKGRTIAVLGCGVDVVYPSSNYSLRQSILDSGNMLISEFAPGVQPTRGSFIARNRIISGLSQGVLIIEGTDRSGSLTTASFAATQGRDVFAVPGPINSPHAQAPLLLLKQGARLVTSAQDILAEYAISAPRSTLHKTVRVSDTARPVYELLLETPRHPDDIASCLGWTIIDVTNILSLLEIDGVVSRGQDGKYCPT